MTPKQALPLADLVIPALHPALPPFNPTLPANVDPAEALPVALEDAFLPAADEAPQVVVDPVLNAIADPVELMQQPS